MATPWSPPSQETRMLPGKQPAMVFCCLWKEKTKFISNWREETSWEVGSTPHSRASWFFLYRHGTIPMVGRFWSGPRDLPSVTPWSCLSRMVWADLHQIVAVEEWFSSKAPVFSLTIDNSSGTWPLISLRRQGLKEKWNYRSEQFVPVIVKSISDFIVGTIDLPSIVCTLYPCPGDIDAADPQMDCTLQSGLKQEPSKKPPTGQPLTCVLSVCIALRKRMASFSFSS